MSPQTYEPHIQCDLFSLVFTHNFLGKYYYYCPALSILNILKCKGKSN